MLAACQKAGARLAIAHQGRVTPSILRARELVRQGAIGRLLTMHGAGKEDQRGGGEDLMVLGTHVLDLMCFFAGPPSWCFADASVDGRPLADEDVHVAPEGNGLVAGNQVVAIYGFSQGVRGYFRSYHGQEGGVRRMGLELYGSQGAISIRGSNRREVYLLRCGLWAPADQTRWEPIISPEWEALPEAERLVESNRLLARDLIASVEEGRDPISSGADGRTALEMIMAVYASTLSCRRVALPLTQREHPLARIGHGK
jgi:predicted dehydrogenase